MKARAFALAACLALASAQAAEEHGKTDVFTAPGVTLAWAVARAPDEARTVVVIRVVADAAIKAISVTGRDPFSQADKVWIGATPLAGRMDVRIPRAGFADFPRTELRFYAAPGDAGAKPRLEVFYLGVPDTTPEFADSARLDAYLDDRIAKARAGAAR